MEQTPFSNTQMMIETDFEIQYHREPYHKPIEFHNHDFWEFYIFLDGNVTYHIEDKVYTLCSADILIIPPGKMHRPVITNQQGVYERIVLWVNSHYITSIDGKEGYLITILKQFEQQNNYRVNLDHKEFKLLTNILEKLIEAFSDKSHSISPINQAYITIFISLISKSGSAQNDTQQSNVVPQIINYINEHLNEVIYLDDLCNRFFISKFHLIRKFKEYTNATVYDYIIAKRIILAKKFLREGATATIACQQCGFTDYSNFYKSFKQKTGMTPSQFKAEIITISS